MPAKKPAKKSAGKPAKKAAKKAISKAARKTAPKKLVAKKVAKPVKKVAAKTIKKSASKPAIKPAIKKASPSKPVIVHGKAKTALTSTTAKGATTISVYKPEVESDAEAVVEEKKLLMLPPARTAKQNNKPGAKKAPQLKPIKGAPTPVATSAGDEQWSAAELKTVRAELAKDLIRLKAELAEIESEMDDLIERDGIGAGDDQADAGTKTFEREHEMSLVYNAKDMVSQTERALERIDRKSYGTCEDCQSPIGKARLKVFPRATLCMKCKAKEERR